jgi:hypothetical protein
MITISDIHVHIAYIKDTPIYPHIPRSALPSAAIMASPPMPQLGADVGIRMCEFGAEGTREWGTKTGSWAEAQEGMGQFSGVFEMNRKNEAPGVSCYKSGD